MLGCTELQLEFSISACTRPIREGEMQGRDYHFMTLNDFKGKIDENQFLEWEEVYKNSYYGTLKSELERIWSKGNHILFDVDVQGGINLKQYFQTNALSVFVMPPSLEILRQRLEKRGTETPDKILKRINKAGYEMKFASRFDKILVNDDLTLALKEAENMVKEFLIQ